MAAKLAVIFYDATSAQSCGAWGVALQYARTKNYTVTSVNTAAANESALAALISAITINTLTAVIIACGTQATYSTAGKFTGDQVASLDSLLVTGSKGTVVTSGTCQSNSTVTNIVLAAGASAVTDYYKGMFIKTAGTTAVYRKITAYDGSTKIATVATTTTAVTTTETYTVYTNSNAHIVGDANSNENAIRYAWNYFFTTAGETLSIGTSNKDIPLIVNLLGGYGTGFKEYRVTALTADSFNATTLTDASPAIVASAEIGKYLSVVSATTGAGQTVKITSNSTTVYTFSGGWPVATPTGTVVYQVSDALNFALWDNYLPYAILTYLSQDTGAVHVAWNQLLDRYNKLGGSGSDIAYDLDLLTTYAQRGQCIFQAKALGIVS